MRTSSIYETIAAPFSMVNDKNQRGLNFLPKQTIRTLVCLLLTMCLISACSESEKVSPSPLRLSINIWAGDAQAFIAKEKGFFAAQGVDVELVLRKSNAASNELFKNGDVDGTFCVYADAIMFNTEGTPNRVVYVMDYSDTGDVIIGKSEYRSLADLSSGVVSFEGVNTFSQLMVVKLLNARGIDEVGMRFADIPAMDVLKALESGTIDAGHTWQPITGEAVARGYRVLAKAGDLPGLITDVLSFSEPIVRERPEDIQGVVKALLQARVFLANHRDEAIAIMAKSMDMSPERMEQGIQEIHIPDLQEHYHAMQAGSDFRSLYFSGRAIAEFFMNRGQIAKMPDLERIIDSRFLENEWISHQDKN